MAVLSSSFVGSQYLSGTTDFPSYKGSFGFLNETATFISSSIIDNRSSPIYRGRLGGAYVFSVGSIPGGGATDITIIGYI